MFQYPHSGLAEPSACFHHHCIVRISIQKVQPFPPSKAASMLESHAVIGDTDMRQAMQQYALRLAGKALDDFEAADSTEIARFIKKEFDRSYGPGWQCIVGTDFGSFVTHHSGCFIYFGIGNLAILLFKGGAGVAPHGGTIGEQARLTALKAAVEA